MFVTKIHFSDALFLLIFTGMVSASVISPSKPTPLYVTPLIDQNRAQEARNLSLVSSELFNITSYSGFVTVDEKYNSNIFYWYFPVANRNLESTPWIIWLQGGPGATSLYGLFKEVGPFSYDDKLEMRETTWWKKFSMVFVDNPVGAGFSFTTDDNGYPRDIETYSTHLYSVVKQLTVVYPELGKAPLYLAGESYAGHYIPGLAIRILETQKKAESVINLQGLIMGNPVMDRDDMTDITSAFYNWGLIDTQGAVAVKPLQDEYYQAVQSGDAFKAYDLRNKLLDKLHIISEKMDTYNLLKDYDGLSNFKRFVDEVDVRRMIHVGYAGFDSSNSKVHTYLRPDFLAHISPKMEEILENYRVLIYCGQLDLTAPCTPNAEGRRRKWQWSGREDFLNAPRKVWHYNGSIAGYVKSGGRFTEALVTGAGHLVPIDKPEETLSLVSNFIENIEINLRSPAENVPEYVEYQSGNAVVVYSGNDVKGSDGLKTGLIASGFINVLLVIALVMSVVIFIRWKRQNSLKTPSSEFMLSLE